MEELKCPNPKCRKFMQREEGTDCEIFDNDGEVIGVGYIYRCGTCHAQANIPQ